MGGLGFLKFLRFPSFPMWGIWGKWGNDASLLRQVEQGVDGDAGAVRTEACGELLVGFTLNVAGVEAAEAMEI